MTVKGLMSPAHSVFLVHAPCTAILEMAACVSPENGWQMSLLPSEIRTTPWLCLTSSLQSSGDRSCVCACVRVCVCTCMYVYVRVCECAY